MIIYAKLGWTNQPMKMRETSRAVDKKLQVNNDLGKQTNLTKIEQYSSTAVEGKEFTDDSKTTLNTTNFDRYADMLPWWHDDGDYSMNGEVGANAVKNPTYAVIECSKEKIHVIVYQVTGNKTSEEVNGVQMPVFPDFEEVRNKMNRTVIYECEILQSDRADRTTR